jgi:acetyl esterase/lipase
VIPLPAPLQIVEKTNIPYTASQELLDVFSPVQAGSWPVVIVLHGSGDIKEAVRNLAKAIAGLGAVVYAPSYDTEKGPAGAFEDVACAMRFARAHASQYGAKDERLIVVGHSLGGMAGALMMFAGDEFNGDCLTPQGSALPDAEIGLDGGFDPIPFIPAEKCQSEPDACLKIDPFTYVSRKPIRSGVRFALLVGDYRRAQQDAQAFRDALQAAGYDVKLAQIPGLNHNEMEMPQPEILSTVLNILHPPAP